MTRVVSELMPLDDNKKRKAFYKILFVSEIKK